MGGRGCWMDYFLICAPPIPPLLPLNYTRRRGHLSSVFEGKSEEIGQNNTVPVLPPKPLAILPKQDPPMLFNRVSPTFRSPLMGSNTQPAPSILFNTRTRDGVVLLEPPNATTELSFSANRYGFI